jgi:hypothetical protein
MTRKNKDASTHTNPAAQSLTRVSSFDYHPAMDLLIRETVELGTQYTLIKEYQRDSTFGNIIKETVSGPDIVTRTTLTEYDSRGRFAIKVNNAGNHVETR